MHPRQREDGRPLLGKPLNVGEGGPEVGVTGLAVEGLGYVYPLVLVQVDNFHTLTSCFVIPPTDHQSRDTTF